MENTFCTIITADYFPKALALYKSIKRYNQALALHVLIADDKTVSGTIAIPGDLIVVPLAQLQNYSLVSGLTNKYGNRHIDLFRWSLKPVFMHYLLENGFDKVLYMDCDLFFVNDYNFLFADLEDSSILLTPHWKNTDPIVDKDSFYSVFTDGIFNAGFIGASSRAKKALLWWSEACHFSMGYHPEHGIRDDQKYLDVFPVKFEAVKIVRHRGCNVAAWNYEECRREMVNGQLLINGEYPLIFIHFDSMMIQGILRGHDKLLQPYFEAYQKTFNECGIPLSEYIKIIDSHVNPGVFKKVKWKLRIRTRVKRMLRGLADRI